MANKMIIDAVITCRFEQCMYIGVTLLKYGIFYSNNVWVDGIFFSKPIVLIKE